MDGWVSATRRILARAPTRALPLTLLMEELKADGSPVEGREEWLLQILRNHPDTFVILAGRLGPWARSSTDPWIILLEDPPPAFSSMERGLRRLQAGLRAWGRTLDRGSQAAVARWIRGTREMEGTLRTLMGGEPEGCDGAPLHPRSGRRS